MTLLDHAWDDSLRHDEWCIEVYIDDLLKFLYTHLCHGNALDDTGIVYKDVYHAEFFLDVGNHGLDILFLGHIADVAPGIYALGLIVGQSLLEMVLAAAVECNLCSCLGKSLSHCETYSIGSSCYQCHLPFKGEFL